MIDEAYELKRIVEDAGTAIDALEAIIYCCNRDNFIAENYLKEKASVAKACIEFIEGLCE